MCLVVINVFGICYITSLCVCFHISIQQLPSYLFSINLLLPLGVFKITYLKFSVFQLLQVKM